MARIETKKHLYTHRDDAEWLTREICMEYYNKARSMKLGPLDVGMKKILRLELQQRCDIPEVEAINILNGFWIDDYVRKYARVKGIIEGSIIVEEKDDKRENKEKKDFLDWLNSIDRRKKDDDWKIEDDD